MSIKRSGAATTTNQQSPREVVPCIQAKKAWQKEIGDGQRLAKHASRSFKIATGQIIFAKRKVSITFFQRLVGVIKQGWRGRRSER